MLSREVMGIFCLVVLWSTALLVAASAFQLRGRLAAKAKALGKGRVGVIDTDGTFATAFVEQVGRALDPADVPAITFHDRRYGGTIAGGALVCAGERLEIPAAEDAEIWVDEKRRQEAARCPTLGSFDEAYALARKAKGYVRTVEVPLKKGDRVHYFPGERPVITTFEPARWLGDKARSLVVFAITELFVCGAVTRVALSEPLFGTVSTIGGALAIAFFLGVTPLGVKLRDVARLPSEARLLGVWQRSAIRETEASET